MRPGNTFIYSLLLSSVLLIFPDLSRADITHKVLRSDLPETQMSAQDEAALFAAAGLAEAGQEDLKDEGQDEYDYFIEETEEETPYLADPLAPVNKVFFHLNDKLYFWLLKPASQAYSHLVPEDFRFIFGNAYDNLKAPGRALNNLLQLRFISAGNELIRFVFNSTVGVGGLGDAAKDVFGIRKQEADFGQTLGRYGIGHGIYLVLPLLGPSSVRDCIGIAGDRFMHPMTYVSGADINSLEMAGIFTHEKINDTSFRIGDYESFKESAIDPYISMRDAFIQHRKKAVEKSKE